jgi:hypothetical protein
MYQCMYFIYVNDFLRVLQFPPPKELTATEILLKVALNTINQPTITEQMSSCGSCCSILGFLCGKFCVPLSFCYTLCCIFLFDLRLLITPLVSSIFSWSLYSDFLQLHGISITQLLNRFSLSFKRFFGRYQEFCQLRTDDEIWYVYSGFGSKLIIASLLCLTMIAYYLLHRNCSTILATLQITSYALGV